MGISVGPHVKRYKDIALLLAKYGNSDLLKDAGLDEVNGKKVRLTEEEKAR